MDSQLLDELAENHQLIVTMEENVISGGFGEHVVCYMNERDIKESDSKILNITIPDEYVEQGNVDILKKETGIDKESVVKKIVAEYAKIRERL